jgi:hypothetical protein
MVHMPVTRPNRWWYLLLTPPYFALLYPGFYARQSPALLGIPFFYWYQFAWVLITAVLTGFVYLKIRAR